MPSAWAALLQSALGRGLLEGRHEVDISSTVARTDVGRDGEVHHYRDGDTIIEQKYDATAAAWRSVTYT